MKKGYLIILFFLFPVYSSELHQNIEDLKNAYQQENLANIYIQYIKKVLNSLEMDPIEKVPFPGVLLDLAEPFDYDDPDPAPLKQVSDFFQSKLEDLESEIKRLEENVKSSFLTGDNFRPSNLRQCKKDLFYNSLREPKAQSSESLGCDTASFKDYFFICEKLSSTKGYLEYSSYLQSLRKYLACGFKYLHCPNNTFIKVTDFLTQERKRKPFGENPCVKYWLNQAFCLTDIQDISFFEVEKSELAKCPLIHNEAPYISPSKKFHGDGISL